MKHSCVECRKRVEGHELFNYDGMFVCEPCYDKLFSEELNKSIDTFIELSKNAGFTDEQIQQYIKDKLEKPLQ